MNIKDFSPLWDSWEIGEILGQGTYGTVYKLTKEEFGKEYYSAVKHISIPMNQQQTRELQFEGIVTKEEIAAYYERVMLKLCEEIKTCYELKGNSYIVSYEDHKIIPKEDSIGYDIFIKMELLTPLPIKLKERDMTSVETAKLGVDLCCALETLQQKRIIHRDIKPSNLFIGDNGNYKLGDFGVARELNKTLSGLSLKGTYRYMPPEVLKGESVNFTADIYSLGLVMYTLLNNNRPPFAPNPPQTVSYEDSERANSLRMQGKKLLPPANADPELANIILKACEYQPANRWKDAKTFRKHLEKYIESKENKNEEAVSYNYVENDQIVENQIPEQIENNQVVPKTRKRARLIKILLIILLLPIVLFAVFFAVLLINAEPIDMEYYEPEQPGVTVAQPLATQVTTTESPTVTTESVSKNPYEEAEKDGTEIPSSFFDEVVTGKILTEKADSFINFRRGPSKERNAFSKIKNGEEIEVIGYDDSDEAEIWLFVKYKDKFGWVSGKYVDY